MSFPYFKSSCALPSDLIKSPFLPWAAGPPRRGPSPVLQLDLVYLQPPPLLLEFNDSLALPQTFQPYSYLRAFAPTLSSAWKALLPSMFLHSLPHSSRVSAEISLQNTPLSQSLSLSSGLSPPRSIYLCLTSCFLAVSLELYHCSIRSTVNNAQCCRGSINTSNWVTECQSMRIALRTFCFVTSMALGPFSQPWADHTGHS